MPLKEYSAGSMLTELVSETIVAGLRCDNAIDEFHGGKSD